MKTSGVRHCFPFIIVERQPKVASRFVTKIATIEVTQTDMYDL